MRGDHSRRFAGFGALVSEQIDASADPGLGAERSEGLKLAVLVLLERPWTNTIVQ